MKTCKKDNCSALPQYSSATLVTPHDKRQTLRVSEWRSRQLPTLDPFCSSRLYLCCDYSILPPPSKTSKLMDDLLRELAETLHISSSEDVAASSEIDADFEGSKQVRMCM
jgi:hypothetical protein